MLGSRVKSSASTCAPLSSEADPETVILRKVLKPRLIFVFVSVVAVGIVIVGFIFNLIM